MFHSTHSVLDLPGRRNAHRRTGFTLVELLVTLTIISILSSIAVMSILGTKNSRDLADAAYSVQGALEQARTYAMSENTYTWIGFFEENPATPGTSGVGQVVVATVASSNGMNLATSANAPYLPGASLTQVAKLLKIPSTHLAVVPTGSVTRPALATFSPADTYQLGTTDFPNPTSSPWSFYYPPGSTSATAQYTFTQIIQFSPQGDATRVSDNPTTLMELGLAPAHGGVVPANNANFAVIQVSGIGGQVITYRP